jgi:hypothetical protein
MLGSSRKMEMEWRWSMLRGLGAQKAVLWDQIGGRGRQKGPTLER